MLQHGLGENFAKISMSMNYYKSCLYASLLAIGILSSSCDRVISSIKKEFDSERPLAAPSKVSTIQPEVVEADIPIVTSSEPATITPKNTSGSFVYFIRGNNISLTALKQAQNYYLLQMKTMGNPMISFGGINETRANYLNNLIFFNQWSKGVQRTGALILLRSAPYNNPKDPCITVIVMQPQYDVDLDFASFILDPQEEMRSEFLDGRISSCILLIKSNE